MYARRFCAKRPRAREIVSYAPINFPISGAIFEQGTEEVQAAFKYAMLQHNQNVTGRRFELQAYVDVINTADAFKLSRISKSISCWYTTSENCSQRIILKKELIIFL